MRLSLLVALISMLAGTVYVFGLDSFGPSGTNQVISHFSRRYCRGELVLKMVMTWREIEKGMIETISMSLQALLILLMVGSLIGSWILCRHGSLP